MGASVNLVVAVTDDDWFDMLRQRPDLDEVNFWAPSAGRAADTVLTKASIQSANLGVDA